MLSLPSSVRIAAARPQPAPPRAPRVDTAVLAPLHVPACPAEPWAWGGGTLSPLGAECHPVWWLLPTPVTLGTFSSCSALPAARHQAEGLQVFLCWGRWDGCQGHPWVFTASPELPVQAVGTWSHCLSLTGVPGAGVPGVGGIPGRCCAGRGCSPRAWGCIRKVWACVGLGEQQVGRRAGAGAAMLPANSPTM